MYKAKRNRKHSDKKFKFEASEIDRDPEVTTPFQKSHLQNIFTELERNSNPLFSVLNAYFWFFSFSDFIHTAKSSTVGIQINPNLLNPLTSKKKTSTPTNYPTNSVINYILIST